MKSLALILLIVFCVTCASAKDQSELKLARDFVDAYYVFADQAKALQLSTGQAAHLLNEELNLLKTVGSKEDAYRSRTVLFALKKQSILAQQALFLFELTIKIPNFQDRKELVMVSVDRKANKVKDFKTL